MEIFSQVNYRPSVPSVAGLRGSIQLGQSILHVHSFLQVMLCDWLCQIKPAFSSQTVLKIGRSAHSAQLHVECSLLVLALSINA